MILRTHPYPKRSSPIRLSMSGRIGYKGR